MLYLKEVGFCKLSLGIVLFLGMGVVKMLLLFYWFGLMVWCFGGCFYNFCGLCVFKSKFELYWELCYFVVLGLVGVFVMLVDLLLLVGGWCL